MPRPIWTDNGTNFEMNIKEDRISREMYERERERGRGNFDI